MLIIFLKLNSIYNPPPKKYIYTPFRLQYRPNPPKNATTPKNNPKPISINFETKRKTNEPNTLEIPFQHFIKKTPPQQPPKRSINKTL